MKSLTPLVVVAIVAVSFTAPVNAQFFYDTVKSDPVANTAAGTNALFTLDPANESLFGCSLTGNAYCSGNTAFGYYALYDNEGQSNTAVGNYALVNNQIGNYNTATGAGALYFNDSGATSASNNTADGAGALSINTSGSNNTAVGFQAMAGAVDVTVFGTGSYNTAIGANALLSYTTGAYNTATGYGALYSNTTGNYNAAFGYQAMYSNQAGVYNLAVGGNALYFNANGYNNMALGYFALYNNQGNYNTAIGEAALYNNSSGSSNIGIGQHGGINLSTGSNNIDIGSPGVAGESGVIRIGNITGGTSTQSSAYIAGIYNVALSGNNVVVTSNGQLGVAAVSSERFKTDIAPMSSDTAKLQQLRPVSFHLKSDPEGSMHYGLIAEEVAKVYPELVIRDQDGRIDGVHYDELAPMLLNEVQNQAAEIRDLKQKVTELSDLKQQLHAALDALTAKEQLVAQR